MEFERRVYFQDTMQPFGSDSVCRTSQPPALCISYNISYVQKVRTRCFKRGVWLTLILYLSLFHVRSNKNPRWANSSHIEEQHSIFSQYLPYSRMIFLCWTAHFHNLHIVSDTESLHHRFSRNTPALWLCWWVRRTRKRAVAPIFCESKITLIVFIMLSKDSTTTCITLRN